MLSQSPEIFMRLDDFNQIFTLGTFANVLQIDYLHLWKQVRLQPSPICQSLCWRHASGDHQERLASLLLEMEHINNAYGPFFTPGREFCKAEAWCPEQSQEFRQRGKTDLLSLGLSVSTIWVTSVGWHWFGYFTDSNLEDEVLVCPFCLPEGPRDQQLLEYIERKIFFWNNWNCWKVKYCLNKPTTPQHFWRYDNCQWGLMTSEQKQPLEISTSWCPRSLWFSNITGESSSTSTNSTC